MHVSTSTQVPSVNATGNSNLGVVRIVDDEPGVLNYLTTALSSRNIPCEGFQTVEEFFATDAAPPSCVLVDWRLPSHDGLIIANRCRERWPHAAVVLISGYATVSVAVQAMRQGLDGVLKKPIGLSELVTEIQSALVRSRTRSAEEDEKADARRRLEKLLPQEMEILKLLSVGMPNKNMATRLSIAVRTIEKYRRSLFDRLGVDSAAEATRILVLADLDE